MRRNGIDWVTIAKISGHKSVENLIKHYDLSVEVFFKRVFIHIAYQYLFKSKKIHFLYS